MSIQIVCIDNAIIEICDVISFSQTHTSYRVNYWTYPGIIRYFAIKKEDVDEVYINGRLYTVGGAV